jgi:YHS domain-containing protein
MYKKTLVLLLVIMAFALTNTVTVSAQAAKEGTVKATGTKPMTFSKFANTVAVCACGKVFVPNADTKTFTYEGKEYACCSEECHKKLAGMKPEDAAKLCMDQIKKLETPVTPVQPPEKK